MSCLFTQNLIYCHDFIVGGINQVYLANKSEITSLTFDTGDTMMSEVQTLVPLSGQTWYEFTVLPQTVSASEKQVNSNNGRWFFQKELSFTIDYLEPVKRSALHELINSNNITVVFKTNVGNWFIMGEDFGCKVSDYNATTDIMKGNNQYTIKLSTTGKYQMRNLSTSFVEANITV